MLTPQEIQQANQATGFNVPLNGKPPVISRAEQIRALAKQSTENPINQDPLVTAGKSLASSFKERGQKQIDIIKNAAQDIGNTDGGIKGNLKEHRGIIEAGLQTAGNVAGAVGDIFGAGLKLMPGLNKKIQEAGQSFLESKNITGQTNAETIQKLSQLAEQHPHLAKDIEASVNILSLGLGAEAEQPIKQAIKNMPGEISETVGSIKNALPEKIIPISTEAKATADKASQLQALKDKIMPKPTAKEAEKALEEGRLVKGQQPKGLLGFFKETPADKIITSEQQYKSIQTIDRLIPEHAKLDEPQLYTEIKNKISEVANNLKPEMQKVKIKPETVQKITDDWKSIKKAQLEDAPATEELNVKKRQAKFESFLKKSKSDNMNDLWETRQAYDDSIPSGVKKANDMSSESLQIQKAEWLQNRDILNKAIHDSENGLGETSKSAFSDMKDLYEANNAIKTKAEINTEAKPSKASKYIKPVLKTAGIGAGAHIIP